MFDKQFEIREFCPACQSSKNSPLYSCNFDRDPVRSYLVKFYEKQGRINVSDLAGGVYELLECKECKLVFQKQILGDYLMEQLYEHWIDPITVFNQEQADFRLDYYTRQAQEISTIIKYFNKPPTSLKLFDFGMGWGKWLRMASAFGIDTYGSELSQSRITYARKFGIKIIDWDDLFNHQFDLINAEQVFEHIPDPLGTLMHLKKIMRPGGLIKISVPNGSDIKKRLKKQDWTADKTAKTSLNAVSPLEHINCFNQNSLIKMASKAGLTRFKMPLSVQYSLVGYDGSLTSFAKDLVRPIYRNYFRGTYLFFGSASS